jgi:predicted peptidase
MILRCLLVAVVLAGFFFARPVRGGQKEKASTGFLSKTFKGADGDAKYYIFIPHSYKADKDYPCILFLHGAGETGSDGLKPVLQGIGNAIKRREDKFQFIVVFPQSQKRTWQAGSADANRALAILDEVKKQYKVDDKRIYLTGLSMGGFGAWSLAAAHPDRWAAIAPICGGGNVKNAEKIKDIPCWCFCGDKDGKLTDACRDMVKALKGAGGEPRYSEFPFVGHNSWDPAYATWELYDWFLKHKLK